MRLFFLSALAYLTLALVGVSTIAENKSTPAKPSPAKAAPEAPQTRQLPNIDPVQLAMLIKSTIMALQHGNQTGNYSVLRDLGTPGFRESFDQARLTASFANLRSRGVNLNPALMLTPNFVKQPEFTPQNLLHFVGNFPTQPLQIQYELFFLMIGGVWRDRGDRGRRRASAGCGRRIERAARRASHASGVDSREVEQTACKTPKLNCLYARWPRIGWCGSRDRGTARWPGGSPPHRVLGASAQNNASSPPGVGSRHKEQERSGVSPPPCRRSQDLVPPNRSHTRT